MKVQNRTCVRRLSLRALAASRTRNLVAVLAIALTAVLFTSLFTIALSINEGFQQATFRQVGGYAHGGFKYITEEQAELFSSDPLVKEWGLRRFLGMVEGDAFTKDHVEVSWADENEADWMFLAPTTGRLPAEGTDEAAADTRVLELLGVEPELGAQFTLPINVDGKLTEETFTLCGWWEKDEATFASHVLLPESRVDSILEKLGVTPPGADGMTGCWNMDVMFSSSLNIEQNLRDILANYGYQCDEPGENYVDIGVNWAYTGAQLSMKLDAPTLLVLAGALGLILLTGYLIIYNVFQISVAGDIRFYGLLKAIGTTPRQLRRIIRIQALALSAAGIPVGLLLGWLLGGALVPVITARLNGVAPVVSASPALFAGAALFALITVLISCRRPGRMAGRVSPVEAVRYTEGRAPKPGARRRAKAVSLPAMALANLGRSRGKTALTMLSLALAVVLFWATTAFAGSFDMDKYTSYFTATDFILANAAHFQTGSEIFNPDQALPEEAIEAVNAAGGVADGARVYGRTSLVLEFVTDDYYRGLHGRWYTEEQLEAMLRSKGCNEAGLVEDTAQLYGMEPFALDQLKVLEGDLSKLNDPNANCIAAVYSEDDYGDLVADSHWAKLGDTVTLRYVEKLEYVDTSTGTAYSDLTEVPAGADLVERAVEYRDVDYTVAALVAVPNALDYGYYGADEFVMGSETFLRDTGTDNILYYAFNAEEGADDGLEAFLQNYTRNVDPTLDYESKATFTAEFESIRQMFLLLGGALSFIVALVGVLNFFNAIVTSISSRRRELAVLEAVGMTARQLRTMLALEGLAYTLGAAALALALAALAGPVLGAAVERIVWFFTFRSSLWPVLGLGAAFAVLGAVIPLAACRAARRRPVVDRLRQE